MRNHHRNTFIVVLITLAVLLVTPVPAQTPSPVPVPSQFATAKTAFLANADAPAQTLEEKQIAAMVYRNMYRAIASAKLYQMTSTPAQAELSMSTSIEVNTGPVMGGDSFGYAFIRLAVYDTNTHSLLWDIDEPISGAFRLKTFQKNIGTAIAKAIADLKLLASGEVPNNPAAPASTKTQPSRMYQEKH